MDGYRLFMPKEDITVFELAQVIRCLELRIKLDVVDIPKSVQRHFVKTEEVVE
jgi:hypothetical protein